MAWGTFCSTFFGAPFWCRTYSTFIYLFVALIPAIIGFVAITIPVVLGLVSILACGLGLCLLCLLWILVYNLVQMDLFLANSLLLDCHLAPLINPKLQHEFKDRIFSSLFFRAWFFYVLKLPVAACCLGVVLVCFAFSIVTIAFEWLALLDDSEWHVGFRSAVNQAIVTCLPNNGSAVINFLASTRGQVVSGLVGLLFLLLSFQVLLQCGRLQRGLLRMIGGNHDQAIALLAPVHTSQPSLSKDMPPPYTPPDLEGPLVFLECQGHICSLPLSASVQEACDSFGLGGARVGLFSHRLQAVQFTESKQAPLAHFGFQAGDKVMLFAG